MEAVEVTTLRIHRLVVLPGLRDHHQYRVMKGPSGEMQEFEDLVEARGVTSSRGADREGALEIRQVVRGGHGLAGAHPVLIALDGVDLAVVGHVPVRVSERPRGERVGRESRVHQQQRALDPLVGEVGVERAQLRRSEHSLVDEGSRRQRREVGRDFSDELVLHPLASDERQTVDLDTAPAVT